MSYVIPLKYRIPFIFLDKCKIDVEMNSFVAFTKTHKMRIPIQQFSTIFLEPGTSITHKAIKIAADCHTNLIITSDYSTKIYSFGKSNLCNSTNIKNQVLIELKKKHEMARKMLELRFNKPFPEKRSIDQLRGMEGCLMKEEYEKLSKNYNVTWNGRKSFPFNEIDDINKCITIGNACLYGITESVVLSLGYSPAIGFLHGEGDRGFVYDISDIFKINTVIPLAFKIISDNKTWKDMRKECNFLFKKEKIIEKIFDTIKLLFDEIKL